MTVDDGWRASPPKAGRELKTVAFHKAAAERQEGRMRAHFARLRRSHWQALLIVPLVVIVMTWPVFPRIFDSGEFWLHSTLTIDAWQKIWDAWHLGHVLAGQAELYYSDAMFHPRGASLAFNAVSLPHSFLLLAAQQALPVDDAYNLIYLLTLCFNAFCAYALIHHLLKDKWIALYGAIIVGVHVWFTDYVTAPDLLMVGTLPLTIYFLHRSVMENQWRFAALAGLCAGITAFIGIYTFLFLLITVAIYAIHLAIARWRQPRFWLRLLLLLAICASIAQLRIYPMIMDAQALEEGLGHHYLKRTNRDLLDYFVLPANPFSGGFFQSIFNIALAEAHKLGYLGYINIFFILRAIRHKPLRRRLAPWLLLFGIFALMRLGTHLVVNGHAYTDVVLPEGILKVLLPTTLGQIGHSFYYQIGIITPLALLSCLGLCVFLRSKRARMRAAVALLSIIILAVEYCIPRQGYALEGGETAYVDWLRSENESPITVIDLPQFRFERAYFLYAQTLSGYPAAFGWANRNWQTATSYIDSNLILRSWKGNRSAHCLPYNERAFQAELDSLLADGFTHVAVHHWLYGDQFINHSFRGIAAAYADGFVSVYRLRDLRLSCETARIEPPHYRRFAGSSAAIPGRRSAILSFHPSESIAADRFAYLDSLFSDWQSLLHLYLEDGEPVMQSAGDGYPDMASFARDNQVIYLLYNSRDADAAAPQEHAALEDFQLCQREAHEDGAVIERYVARDFACALIASSKPFRVNYDNGIRLENVYLERRQDHLDLQLMWSSLPSESHSASLQIFDAAGAKVLGQDSTIGHASLRRHRVDISSLPPGDYALKLIVYNFDTGHSVSGIASETGVRFERELEIAMIDRS